VTTNGPDLRKVSKQK